MPNIVEEKILELIAVHNFPMRPAPGPAGGSIFGSAGRTIFGSAGRVASLFRSKPVRQQIRTGTSRLDSSEFNARKEKHKKTKRIFRFFLHLMFLYAILYMQQRSNAEQRLPII